MITVVPEWLAAWRETTGLSAPAPQAAAPKPTKRTRTPDKLRAGSLGFAEPLEWAWDGGARREAVLDTDHNPPRLVRHVGWRSCMTCRRPFFSQDVSRVRMCTPCKEVS